MLRKNTLRRSQRLGSDIENNKSRSSMPSNTTSFNGSYQHETRGHHVENLNAIIYKNLTTSNIEIPTLPIHRECDGAYFKYYTVAQDGTKQYYHAIKHLTFPDGTEVPADVEITHKKSRRKTYYYAIDKNGIEQPLVIYVSKTKLAQNDSYAPASEKRTRSKRKRADESKNTQSEKITINQESSQRSDTLASMISDESTSLREITDQMFEACFDDAFQVEIGSIDSQLFPEKEIVFYSDSAFTFFSKSTTHLMPENQDEDNSLSLPPAKYQKINNQTIFSHSSTTLQSDVYSQVEINASFDSDRDHQAEFEIDLGFNIK